MLGYARLVLNIGVTVNRQNPHPERHDDASHWKPFELPVNNNINILHRYSGTCSEQFMNHL